MVKEKSSITWLIPFSLVFVVTILVAMGSASAGDPESALKVTVVDSNGVVITKPYLTLWKAMSDGDEEPESRVHGPAGFGYYDHVFWEDPKSKCRFMRFRSANPNDGRHSVNGEEEFNFNELPAGTYILNAVNWRGNATAPDPTPYGVCEPFSLDGTESTEIKIALVDGTASLTLQVLDEATEEPIGRVALRLRNESGMPIVHGYGSGNFFESTDKEGKVHFEKLLPGKYSAEVMGKHAGTGVKFEYLQLEGQVPVQLEAGKSLVKIPMAKSWLDKEDFDKRNPFLAFGRVADSDGNPVAKATVRVATGMGTLLGGGSTTTDENGKFKLYFGPGLRTSVDPKTSPLGIGVQAAQFDVSKQGWKLDTKDGYLLYLMSDQTRKQFEKMLADEGGKFWSKTDSSEVVFAHAPKEIDFVMANEAEAAD